MSIQDDPVSIHYTGLDGQWKSIAFWGAGGIACAMASPIPATTLALVIAGGFAIGSLCALWIYQMKTRWIDPTRLAGAVIMIAATIASGSVHKASGYLAVGSFFSVSIGIALEIFGRQALKKLNQKHYRFLQAAYGENPAPPPPEKDAQSTRNAFLAVLPQPLRDEMAATFVQVTAIDAEGPSESPAPEASSFGGRPLLTPGETWPMRDGRPMDFLAQINLAEVTAFLPDDAPRAGLLSFFYDHEQPWGFDPEDLGSGRILYSSNPNACIPLDPVAGESLTPQQALRFRREIAQDIPDELDERFHTYFRSLETGEKSLLETLHERVGELDISENRLFSAPAPVQSQMSSELAAAAAAYGLPADTEWIMVLQLGSVDEQDWCWGDAGCLYFWIPRQDLTMAHFDRPWVILQCT